MKNKFCFLLMMVALMVGSQAVSIAGLVDLGVAGTPNLDGNASDIPKYLVSVSKDGKLISGTDESGNGFIWTQDNGKKTIGTGVRLVGVDWLGANVLAVGNTNGGNYPVWWQGNADGTGGAWTNLPAVNGADGLDGYWQATSLGVSPDASDWWVAGFTSGYPDTSPYETDLRYKRSTDSATTIDVPSGGHNRAFFYSASDDGTFTGRAQFSGGGPPMGGSRNGIKWSSGPTAIWLGPPEAGTGSEVSSLYECSAIAISGDGTTVGGANKSDPVTWYALYWDSDIYVHQLPLVQITESQSTDWQEVHSLNKSGTIMGGIYYITPADTTWEAFVYFRATDTVVKLADLLASYGMNTNGWTFRDVTGLSDDGYTLVGYGVTNGMTHAWVAQLPKPSLSISGLGANVVLSWATNFSGFTLELNTDLNTTTWTDVPDTPYVVGTNYNVTLPVLPANQFYRLKK